MESQETIKYQQLLAETVAKFVETIAGTRGGSPSSAAGDRGKSRFLYRIPPVAHLRSATIQAFNDCQQVVVHVAVRVAEEGTPACWGRWALLERWCVGVEARSGGDAPVAAASSGGGSTGPASLTASVDPLRDLYRTCSVMLRAAGVAATAVPLGQALPSLTLLRHPKAEERADDDAGSDWVMAGDMAGPSRKELSWQHPAVCDEGTTRLSTFTKRVHGSGTTPQTCLYQIAVGVSPVSTAAASAGELSSALSALSFVASAALTRDEDVRLELPASILHIKERVFVAQRTPIGRLRVVVQFRNDVSATLDSLMQQCLQEKHNVGATAGGTRATVAPPAATVSPPPPLSALSAAPLPLTAPGRAAPTILSLLRGPVSLRGVAEAQAATSATEPPRPPPTLPPGHTSNVSPSAAKPLIHVNVLSMHIAAETTTFSEPPQVPAPPASVVFTATAHDSSTAGVGVGAQAASTLLVWTAARQLTSCIGTTPSAFAHSPWGHPPASLLAHMRGVK